MESIAYAISPLRKHDLCKSFTDCSKIVKDAHHKLSLAPSLFLSLPLSLSLSLSLSLFLSLFPFYFLSFFRFKVRWREPLDQDFMTYWAIF